MNLEQAIQTLQDNLIVIAEIERRHAATLQQHEDSVKDLFNLQAKQTKLLDAMSAAALAQIEINATTSAEAAATNKTISQLNAEAAAFRQRTEQNLAEITDKLNGLIGYIDGMKRPGQ